ncbi:alpha/beta hydrolase-fold protein [Acanthopleuribacter pedis]|uniref:Esterase n=1 Tax=Acanthopleuribacter pedis TaxID=442870 RepID=A0A8J7QG38_9BACT|nr:alpha/beta hydrolase-fold protein [Acanthopleuribacter pedis]MBO1319385.1 hypothetical protein [Acanthopleuribacter pedis]
MIVFFFSIFCWAGAPSPPAAAEQVAHLFQATLLGEDRPVTVHLPDGYHDTQQGHPVLYILDGQKRTRDTLTITNYLIERGQMPPLILVSIPHTGNRRRDYDPWDRKTGAANPGATAFGAFLAEEVIPWVEARFRTKPHRLILGHSAAGVFVLHQLITQPDLFQSRLVFSPSLHHHPKLVDSLAAAFAGAEDWNSRIYLNIGGMEFAPIRAQFERLEDVFARHAPAGLRASFQTFPHDGHGTTPFVGVYSALKAQFVQARPSLEQMRQLLADDAVVGYYKNLSRAFGYPVVPAYRDLSQHWSYHYFAQNDPQTAAKITALMRHYHPDRVDPGDAGFVAHWDRHGIATPYPDDAPLPRQAFLNQFGYAYLTRDRFAEAVFLFECNTRFYPQSPNTWDSLGEALQRAGRTADAHAAFRRALSLAESQQDRDLDRYRARLKQLAQQPAAKPR